MAFTAGKGEIKCQREEVQLKVEVWEVEKVKTKVEEKAEVREVIEVKEVIEENKKRAHKYD